MTEQPLQLHRLEGFYWVGRERGYAAGARAYPHPISQPGIYQQVKKLEADLGTSLFERIGKAELRLTPAGERLFAFCAPFFEKLPRVTRAIRAQAFGGSLRIDASAVVIRELLPRWLPALRDARPDIRADVSEVAERSERSEGSLARLLAGEVDLVLDFLDFVPAQLETRVVGNCHSFLVLAADHPLAKRRAPKLEELRELPFVSYQPGQHHFDIQMRAIRSAIGEPNRAASASNVDAILELVRAGLGYSAIPWLDAGGPVVPGIRAYRQRGRKTRFPILAAWLGGDCPHPLVEAALAALPDP